MSGGSLYKLRSMPWSSLSEIRPKVEPKWTPLLDAPRAETAGAGEGAKWRGPPHLPDICTLLRARLASGRRIDGDIVSEPRFDERRSEVGAR